MAPVTLDERQPITLVNANDSQIGEQGKDVTIKNMTTALRCMIHLKVSHWAIPIVPSIVREVSKLTRLEEFSGFSLGDGTSSKDENEILEVQKLALVLKFRLEFPEASNSSSQVSEKGFADVTTIANVWDVASALVAHIPNLRRLEIIYNHHVRDPPPDLVQNIVSFLARHPSVSELEYWRNDHITFPPHILPNLRKLSASTFVLNALEASYQEPGEGDAAESLVNPHTRTKLDIEYLHIPIGAQVLNNLQCLNRNCLTGFRLGHSRETTSNLQRMGDLFPSIRWLSSSWALDFTLDQSIDILIRFKNLEKLMSGLLYGSDSLEIHNAILRLAPLCPKLSQIPSYLGPEQTQRQGTRIYIMRELISDKPQHNCRIINPGGIVEVDGQRIWYEIKSYRGKHVFYDSRDGPPPKIYDDDD
ncbi:hypothetical protein BDN72DRAFT_862649 [Pluteus cervinus]|uniref:Uncharacterized protein n=1 Tax=Pluteus cervinus TaxID=181527 RepID=A0ACD3AAG7_9AGAR|nr:hypothetical protein BDN72DRAFT_862649 [Pluteus cervinus]